MDMARTWLGCVSSRQKTVRDVVIPKDIPVLRLPSMQSMMAPETRCIALAAFGTDDDLQGYLDDLNRNEKKIRGNFPEPSTGTTPLLAAIRRDAPRHVRILIGIGADPCVANKAGWTPLMAAKRHASGSPEINDMLLAVEGQSGYVEAGAGRAFFS